MDRIWVYISVRDEEDLMPFLMRHYLSVAQKVVVQDCGSTDMTRAIVQHYGAEFRGSDIPWGMDERRRRDDAQQFVHEAAGKCEWIIAPDADEFVLGDFNRALGDAGRLHCDVLHTIGWTMHGDGLPKDDGKSQIYQLSTLGDLGGAKPIVVRSGGDFLWSSGKHFIETQHTRIAQPLLHLLHYRYMGGAYTAKRNARNYERSVEKLTAWACHPDYTGNESARAAEMHKERGVNVLAAMQQMNDYSHGAAYAPHLDNSQMIMP